MCQVTAFAITCYSSNRALEMGEGAEPLGELEEGLACVLREQGGWVGCACVAIGFNTHLPLLVLRLEV